MADFDDAITYAGAGAAGNKIVANWLRSAYLQRGLFANMPAAGNEGVVYAATDGKDGTGTGDYLYLDNGSAWVDLGYVVNQSAQTFVGVKTLTSPVINTSISGSAILDEDDLASNSASQVATQQSIKAYVDAEIANISGIFIPASAMIAGGGVETYTQLGNYPAWLLPDNDVASIQVSGRVPFTPSGVFMVLRPSGTGNLYWHSSHSEFGAVGEDYNTNTDSVSGVTLAVTANQINMEDISEVFTGFAAGDAFGLFFQRTPTNPADTVNGTVHIIGLLLMP